MEIKNMTLEELEEAKKIGYVAKLQGYDIYKSGDKLYSELKSVWPTFSEKTRDNWAMILGGLNGKSEVMALMSECQEG